MRHLMHVVGARPNFVKVAPVLRALQEYDIRQTLVHTGQHYDANMSDVFFTQLEIPEPDINLEVGSGSHASQTAEIMRRLEPVVVDRRPDLVLVYGDVNSTLAATLVCSKLLVPVAHVEAGLRSFDRTMPEEINRLVTDCLSDVLFTPSEDADANLHQEGIPKARIHLVGNVMIDSLMRSLPKARNCKIDNLPRRFALLTLHRPANVDDSENLLRIMQSVIEACGDLEIVFPVHPRTRQRLSQLESGSKLHLLEPVPYVQFLSLQSRAAVVITDSGGIQEETTYLGIPCLTLRESTERPVTVSLGTNTLIGNDLNRLQFEMQKILAGSGRKGVIPPLWDGETGKRIAKIIARS